AERLDEGRQLRHLLDSGQVECPASRPAAQGERIRHPPQHRRRQADVPPRLEPANPARTHPRALRHLLHAEGAPAAAGTAPSARLAPGIGSLMRFPDLTARPYQPPPPAGRMFLSPRAPPAVNRVLLAAPVAR